jgi:tetratricopeptide (TPR) repeat protein
MSARAARVILYAILLACTAALYLPVRQFQFVNWDDRDMVIENPLLHPPTVQHLRDFWTGPHLDLYTPLSYSLWWTMARLSNGPDDAASYHLLNLFLHMASAALAFSILLRCVTNPPACFAGAIVFALHPMQVESVAWIAQMNGLLAGALSLAAIRLYLLFADDSKRRRWVWYFIATIVFLLALLAKPTAVVVPLIAAILDAGIVRRPVAKVVRSLALWFCMAIVFAVVTRSVQPVTGGVIWHRPLIALDALGFYFRQVFWPARLTADYARAPLRVWMSHQWMVNGSIPLFIALLLWPMRGGRRQLIIAAALAVAALLPVLGLIPFAQQRYSTVADRYVYLAMIGPALLVAWALARMPRPAGLALTMVLACSLAWLTAAQLQTWRNTEALIAHVIQIDPNSTIGNKIKAAELSRTGHPQEAIAYYRAAMIRNPNDGDLHLNLANAFYRCGRYQDAILEYNDAINLPSGFRIGAMLDLGWAYVKSGQVDAAKRVFRQVLEIDPNNPQAMRSLEQLSSADVPSP